MAYIGPAPKLGQNREVDDISSGFNGSTTAFTLQVGGSNVSPGSANSIIVSVNNVIQNPNTDYSINGSTITFTSAPTNGHAFFAVVLNQGVDTSSPADGSVTAVKLGSSAVTFAKMQDISQNQLIGRTSSGSGAPTNLSAANVRSMINVADGATNSPTITINSNANNRVITGSGTANTLEAESALTFSSDVLSISSTTQGLGARFTNTGNEYTNIQFSANRTSARNALGIINAKWNNNDEVAAIYLQAGDDTTNKDDGIISFFTKPSGGNLAQRLIIQDDGDVTPGSDNATDLGRSNLRWANVYTTDLHLSNKGSQNDVDSTWGDYTIQEGFDELFLINHRTGKKFKFNLTEVG